MTVVLFVCVENACRSQMAEAIFNSLAPPAYRAISAGSRPRQDMDGKAVAVLKEVGIKIDGRRPKLLTSAMAKEADRVVTMGCADACPIVPKALEDWGIEDPSGKSIVKYREVRDLIRSKVVGLIAQLSQGKEAQETNTC